MPLAMMPFLEQSARWPRAGRCILAQFDEESVVVYQAYDPSIAEYALREGRFGGAFSFGRMSWIKPGFLWMMYRSGWGEKEGQRVVLAIRLRRDAFETILNAAVPSTYDPALYSGPEAFQAAIAASSVRLQWDPDHDPQGNKLERRAIQLGLRGDFLRRYATEWILEIQDVSELVREQRRYALNGLYDRLLTPSESVYPVRNPELAAKLGLEGHP
ncbi:MAG TPA: DUF4291 domain-containing protein [Symbiobacteriaceae bacterium]|nr:DUF4291 domain-containing protein [Symbiobacteriaceae bacterium]